jgi:hypothetical protein
MYILPQNVLKIESKPEDGLAWVETCCINRTEFSCVLITTKLCVLIC